MVSAFQNEKLGFGFYMTPEELAAFNATRSASNKLERSPGLRFLQYGTISLLHRIDI